MMIDSMVEINKVIKGLEECIKGVERTGHSCPYWNHEGHESCRTKVEIDALKLLKEQQETIQTQELNIETLNDLLQMEYDKYWDN